MGSENQRMLIGGAVALAAGFLVGDFLVIPEWAGLSETAAEEAEVVDSKLKRNPLEKKENAKQTEGGLSVAELRDEREAIRERIVSDPDAAFFELVQTREKKDNERFHRMIRVWAETSPRELLERSEREQDPSLNLLHYAAYELHMVNPGILLDFASSRPALRETMDSYFEVAALMLASTDPEKAIEMAEQFDFKRKNNVAPKLPDGEAPDYFRGNFKSETAGRIAKSDPMLALSWAEKQNPDDRRKMTEAILATWALAEPAEAAARVGALSNDFGTDVGIVVERIAAVDLAAAALWALEAAPEEKRSSMVGYQLSHVRGVEAIQRVLDAVSDPEMKSNLISRRLESWSKDSPEEGLQWVMEMPPGERAASLEQLGKGVGRSMFDSGLALSSNLPDGEQRDSFVRGLLQSLATYDLEVAVEVAEKTGDEELVLAVIEGGVGTTFENSAIPFQRIAEFVSRIEQSSDFGNSVNQLVRRWYPSDPQATEQWLVSIEGPGRATALRQAAGVIAMHDTDRAVEWAESLPEAVDRDAALDPVITRVVDNDPAKAFALAASLESERSRHHKTKFAIRSWAKRDPAAARVALAESVLTEWEKQRLSTFFYDR